MNNLLVLDVVGLSPKHVGRHTPHLSKLAESGCHTHIQSMLPAVTCSVQTSYFTGTQPSEHGIVGNGWYMQDLCEIKFWHQSNKLVQSEQIWTSIKTTFPKSTSANIFCWFNMYCPADIAVTVRPMYPADGRKIPDIYTNPDELRSKLNNELGSFPLFNFWGPQSSIVSSQWIADATIKVLDEKKPNLAIAYIPHLDYSLQKLGPDHSNIGNELQQVDTVCGQLIDYANSHNYTVVVLSEYGIEPVNQVCYLNRLFRHQGWIQVREELGLELLDPQACSVFAVADHQLAHIHVQNKSLLPEVRKLLEQQPEIDLILDDQSKHTYGLNHPRSGDLIVTTKPYAWFSYYYWLDDNKAPDFSRTVDIHRKPGYDPVELFIDPEIRFPTLTLARKLIKKKIGLRSLMNVIALDASLVKGSHGALNPNKEGGAIYLCSRSDSLTQLQKSQGLSATDIKDHLLGLL